MENRTKKKILAAAATEFAQRSLRHATVRNICNRAGANIAAISYHFGDKQGLYRAVFEQLLPKGTELSLPSPSIVNSVADFEHAVAEWTEQFIGRVIKNRQDDTLQLIQVTMHEMADSNVQSSMLYKLYLAKPLDSLKAILGRVLNLPVDSVEVQVRAFSLVGAFLFYFNYRSVFSMESGDQSFFRKNWEKTSKILLEDFINNVKCSESFIWK